MYSIYWERLKCSKNNLLQVQVTLLDESGKVHQVCRQYQEWIGICTNKIDQVVEKIKHHFPGHHVSYVPLGKAKKILPYFEDRLVSGKLDYAVKPFYKIYTSAHIEDVGRFFKCYKIAYYGRDDWLVRIYIDLCIKYNTFGFYYKWYNVNDNNSLLNSFEMVPDRTDIPDWTIAAFDLETVPLVGNHIPMGYHSTDRIVMISIFKWNKRHGVQQKLYYLLPDGMDPVPGYKDAFRSEGDMIHAFHEFLVDAQIVTGYNINSYDFPCLFARMTWLGQKYILKHYRSKNVGQNLVTTFQNKMTLDLYNYFQNFSGYNLPSFKLDDVARVKLGGDTKIPVKSTGIWSWYTKPLPKYIYESDDVNQCHEYLQPNCKASEFGTFRTYLDYCLKDTELVYRLFEKELMLSFVVVRSNFTALNAVESLHLGNSRYLLELFKTYGTRLGYFFNARHYLGDITRYQFILGKSNTYQGALNYCLPEQSYKDVVVMDFASMYPSTLLSSNLCYGTCTIMPREAWLNSPTAQTLKCIPYRLHSSKDFECDSIPSSTFSYPTFNPQEDDYAIVINPNAEAFLPQIVKHFIQLRQYHQKLWKETKDVYHYNVQLGVKILINSLYGVMANKDSCLAYIPIAVIIVTLSRYQLLGSYHFIKEKGYQVCYADTDSLMVQFWPEDNCNEVNAFLNIPHVELKYEQRMKWLLVLSKKRYIYQTQNNKLVTKGFQKKINGLTKFMTDYILEQVWTWLFQDASPSQGWIIWMDVLQRAFYMCRDAQMYSIYRKIKPIEEYKSKSCASYRYLEKYPDTTDEYVEYTYGRADVTSGESLKFITDAKDCKYVNVEQLFINQKKIYCTLLNITFWHLPDPIEPANMVLNTIRWGIFNRIELLHYLATGRKLLLLVIPGQKYPFSINDHVRKKGKKRKIVLKV